MKKRILSLFLVFVMILGMLPPASASAADNKTPAQSAGTGSAILDSLLAGPDKVSGFAPQPNNKDNGLTKFEPSEWTPFSKSEAANPYAEGDIVTFIVVTDNKPLMKDFSVGQIAAQTEAVKRQEALALSNITAVQQKVQNAFGKEDGFKIGFTYTIATTGFSVTTAYGNKAAIEQMAGVKEVYVAPVFSLPTTTSETTLVPLTDNSSTMIGADVLNATGYTGKGQRIAILDTGVKVDHPSFAALPESALEDPMTRESVEEIWTTLNAGKMTKLLNVSYYSTKIPFMFNYVAGNFDASNLYVGIDHGTHVAGIAAANKIEGVKAVGMAPDAQIIAMQVFQQNGGASWDTIVAALEDCVRLEVDTVNLSLGMAAGFTDSGIMMDVMDLFMDSDMQLLIAVGNDTHNALGNAWGYHMSLIENPDIGLIGTPATYSAALGIASVDNDGYRQLYFTVDGQDIGYQDTATSDYTNFAIRFADQTLEYVIVPGLGEPSDYVGLDVEGKVAVVTRGITSFMDKQAAAQEAGAIACIIYNNAMGLLNMQVNDGEGYIPCVGISASGGEILKNGSGTLKVSNFESKVFKQDRSVSSFSSWGVTPDLKLKPELSGVGGDIYSTVDRDLSGADYGTMSGTSMATPQITGAMAVLIQYLDENFPEITGSAQRRLAANLLMSTADPVMVSQNLEYSPRAQGAGLANLVSATTTKAYLSNADASEGRPKIEFGDDPTKEGVFGFSFTIHNMADEAQTFEITSSVMTESIFMDAFISNTPYALEAKVEVEGGNQVVVPANSELTVHALLTLTEADVEYLAKFPNGIYVEGYVYATPTEGVRLTMPMVGFYGDWSAAKVFDSADASQASLYPALAFTNMSQIGTNPYISSGASGDEYNAFSYRNPLAEVDIGMLRNAKKLRISAVNALTGEEYFEIYGADIRKSYFDSSYGMIVPFYVLTEAGELWNGYDKEGNKLPDGTRATVKFEAWLDDGDDVMDDMYSFDITVDNQMPELQNADDLSASVYKGEDGRTYLKLDILENHYLAAVLFEARDGQIMAKYEASNVPGEVLSKDFDITGFGTEFSIIIADYACNELRVDVELNLGEDTNVGGTLTALDPNRLYGNETMNGAAVESGWFSALKEDMSGAKNETYDNTNVYISAEYINGYIVAQSYANGDVHLITPSGSYWKKQTIIDTNQDKLIYDGAKIIYDMALDHSGRYKANLDPYNNRMNGNDALLGVGWYYAGDLNGDGKDDGYSALFQVVFNPYGQNSIETIGRFDLPDGAEMLTFGITTEGDMYGIDVNGILYRINLEGTMWNDLTVTTEMIGVTDFVDYPGYNGANRVQSMGYDHNTGKMYWYAHSVDEYNYYTPHMNMTYEVNLETAECTEVGTYGPGGQTCLFVPNTLESDLFAMNVDPTGFDLGGIWELIMVEGQKKVFEVGWQPWNAKPVELTWASSDENVFTVDQRGVVIATGSGEATLSVSGTVWDPWAGEYDYETGKYEGAYTNRTVTCNIRVVEAQDALYGFIVMDYANLDNCFTWVTYKDTDLYNVTPLAKPMITISDPIEGTVSQTNALWQGGAYYQGYVYTVMVETRFDENGAFGAATVLYKTKVTKGATPAETIFGEPEEVGYTMGIELSNMGFDYNTGRMYALDMTNGGLALIDLDTGAVDPLGMITGEMQIGKTLPTAMCVTKEGYIIAADMESNLYQIDADTLYATRIAGFDQDAWYYGAMTYDYNTGNIYWNPCNNANQSPLYLVVLEEDEWRPGRLNASIMDLGDVSSKQGVEQCVMFTIPEEEPETIHIPVESITIDQGDTLTGLLGGGASLTATTTPLRPTVQTKTWTTSDPTVVDVDRFGNISYVGVGKATITVSTTNKDEAAHGGPFIDTIEITVLPAAGEFQMFLSNDNMGTGWYDWWLKANDYDLRHASPVVSAISVYTLRVGAYYDGYYYAYDIDNNFMRINAKDPMDYTFLGNCGLNPDLDQITGMAFDYSTGTMYGLTLRSNYDYVNWKSMRQTGNLVKINLDDGSITEVAEMDFDTPVYALAADENGTLYAAGSMNHLAGSATVYTVNKETGELTEFLELPGITIYTGPCYYGTGCNSQMTYDFASKRLYINATSWDRNYSNSRGYGVTMVQLGEETPTVANLGGISIFARTGSTIKYGEVYLALMAFLPEEGEVPESPVNGITLDKKSARTYVGESVAINAVTRPTNAADPTLRWSSADESIATVDENGVITGVSAGKTYVTVTSNENPEVFTVIEVTVTVHKGPASLAYTISADRSQLIAFDPAMPALTAEVVADYHGTGKISGMTLMKNALYYVVYDGYGFSLYRLDLKTHMSQYVASMENWGGLDDIAYDEKNDMLYAVSGFYVFQYNMAQELNPEYPTYYISNYTMDQDTCTMSGVTIIDGIVYGIGTGLYDNVTRLICYGDKYMNANDRFVIASGFQINVSPGATEMDYDEVTGKFYITDAGNKIYSMDMEGNYEFVDLLGDGIDLNGLAIDSTPRYNVVYTDGVEGVELFKDQYRLSIPGSKIAAFNGTLERTGYNFVGWFDENGVEYTAESIMDVEHDLVLTARWELKTYTLTLDTDNGMTMDLFVRYGETVGRLPNVSRDGYTFRGWFDAEGNEITAETVYLFDCDMTVTARWEANTYEITFNTDGGQMEETVKNVVFASSVGTLPEPTKRGFLFVGWFDANGKEYTAETIYTVPGNTELVAKWIVDEYYSQVAFKSGSASLDGTIGLNFYVTMTDTVANHPDAKMVFLHNGRVVEVPVSAALISEKNGEIRYRFTLALSAKEMADDVIAQMYLGDRAIGDPITYSVRQYAMNRLNKSQDEALKDVLKAMLNYGAAAQVYFGYNVEDLANAQMDPADRAVADVDPAALAGFERQVTGAEAGLKLRSSTLILESGTDVRVYFELVGDKSIDEFTFKVDGQVVTPIQSGDRYYIEASGIAADELSQMITFELGGYTVTYGPMTYVLNKLTDSNEGIVDMVKALYAYSQIAESYLG